MVACDPFFPLFTSLRNAIVLNSPDPDLRRSFDPASPLQDYYFTDRRIRMMDAIRAGSMHQPSGSVHDRRADGVHGPRAGGRPAETVREICRWLNVSPPDDPVALTVLGGRNARELPASSSKKGVATPKRVARDMPSAFGYEEVVTPREREFIVFRTRDLAHELGYGLQGGIPATDRGRLLLQWLLPDEWELMNADSRLRLAKAVTARRLYICGKLLR